MTVPLCEIYPKKKYNHFDFVITREKHCKDAIKNLDVLNDYLSDGHFTSIRRVPKHSTIPRLCLTL